MSNIDWTKPIRVTDNPKKTARFLAKINHDMYPIVMVFSDPTGHEYLETCTEDGRIYQGDEPEIENAPETKAIYYNLYSNGLGVNHLSMQSANNSNTAASEERLGLFKMTFTTDGSQVCLERISD